MKYQWKLVAEESNQILSFVSPRVLVVSRLKNSIVPLLFRRKKLNLKRQLSCFSLHKISFLLKYDPKMHGVANINFQEIIIIRVSTKRKIYCLETADKWNNGYSLAELMLISKLIIPSWFDEFYCLLPHYDLLTLCCGLDWLQKWWVERIYKMQQCKFFLDLLIMCLQYCLPQQIPFDIHFLWFLMSCLDFLYVLTSKPLPLWFKKSILRIYYPPMFSTLYNYAFSLIPKVGYLYVVTSSLQYVLIPNL